MRTICLCLSVLLLCSVQVAEEAVIESFDQASGWVVFTDKVLGGKSSAMLKIKKDGTSEFRGLLSKANNAGIAQAISPKLKHDLRQYRGFELRVKGDGNPYHFSLQQQALCKDGQHFEYSFETEKKQWQVIQVPFGDFQAAYFGVPVLGQGLDLEEINHVSFINTEGEGRFELEIDYVKLY